MCRPHSPFPGTATVARKLRLVLGATGFHTRAQPGLGIDGKAKDDVVNPDWVIMTGMILV